MMPLTPAPTTKAEQAIVDRIVEVIDAPGLTNHQAKTLLAKVYRMLEQEDRQEPTKSH